MSKLKVSFHIKKLIENNDISSIDEKSYKIISDALKEKFPEYKLEPSERLQETVKEVLKSSFTLSVQNQLVLLKVCLYNNRNRLVFLIINI